MVCCWPESHSVVYECISFHFVHNFKLIHIQLSIILAYWTFNKCKLYNEVILLISDIRKCTSSPSFFSLISLNFSSIVILNWVMFCYGGFTIGCLAAFLASTCYIPATLQVVTVCRVLQHCQMSVEGKITPRSESLLLTFAKYQILTSLIQMVFWSSASLLNT